MAFVVRNVYFLNCLKIIEFFLEVNPYLIEAFLKHLLSIFNMCVKDVFVQKSKKIFQLLRPLSKYYQYLPFHTIPNFCFV